MSMNSLASKLFLGALALTQLAAAPPAGRGGALSGTGDSRAVADNPERAVKALGQRLLGARAKILVSDDAFEGLPRPGPGVRYVARALGLNEVGLRLSVGIEARLGSRILGRRRYTFVWEVREEVVVPRRVIRAGDTIRHEDLHRLELPLNASFERYLSSREELLGRVALRTLLPDRPVHARSVKRPSVVRRGSPVTVQFIAGPMKLTMEGEAMSDGAVGDSVRVLNPSSNRVLTGQVVDYGLVEVIR